MSVEIFSRFLCIGKNYFYKYWNNFDIIITIIGFVNIYLLYNYKITSFSLFLRTFNAIARAL